MYQARLDDQEVALKLLLPEWCDPCNSRARAYSQHFLKVRGGSIREAPVMGATMLVLPD